MRSQSCPIPPADLALPSVLASVALALHLSVGVGAAEKAPVEPLRSTTRVPCEMGTVAIDWDFSVGPHDFYLVDCDDGGLPVWEYGPTDYVPDAPSRVWGAVLQGDYPSGAGEGLVSPEFFVDSGTQLLEIVHYVDTEGGFDGGNVMAGVWPSGVIIEPIGGYTTGAISSSPSYYAYCVDDEPGWSGPDAHWRTDCFDLTPLLGQTIAVELDFGSDESVTAPGWYVARIRVGGPAVELRACCLPDGSCDLLSEPACLEMGGSWLPELDSCDPSPCTPTRFLSVAGTYNAEPWNSWVGPEGTEITLRADIPQHESETPIVQVEFSLSTDGGSSWDFVGLDSDGTDPRFDSFGNAEPIGDGWSVSGVPVPIPIPDPNVYFRAIAYPEVGEPLILESSRRFDPAPPSLAQTNIEDWTVFEEPLVEFVVDPNGADLERILVLLEPKPVEFIKGVPAIDQHLHSDYHCAPTATAQCFRYFENQGDADIIGGLSDYELVGALGTLMETTPVIGTTLGPWLAGINSWIHSHGNDYTVRYRWHYSWPNPIWGPRDWKFVRDELEKCQDVLMGVYWLTGGGHAMTLNSIVDEPLPGGRIAIGFSDPWTGAQTPAEIDPVTGELFDVGGPGGAIAQVATSIIICPRQDETRFGLPGEVQEDFVPDGEGPYAIPINIPDYGAWYVHVAVVNDLGHEHPISTIIAYEAEIDVPVQPGGTPESYQLLACRPNPFRGETVITFGLPVASNVRIEVFDLAGRLVRRLQDGPIEQGYHERRWDGSDDRGLKVSTGVYYVKMSTTGFERVTKVAWIR